jgi:hypothetical protein
VKKRVVFKYVPNPAPTTDKKQVNKPSTDTLPTMTGSFTLFTL